jgi:uncharacterized RDD family membrane protein YckC
MTGEPVRTAAALPHRAYAGLVSRLAALAIDILLVCVVATSVRVLPEFAWEQLLDRNAPQWFQTACTFVAALVPWLYFTISWWLANQTVGAMLFGTVVLRPDGRELSLAHAALRAWIGLLFAPIWLVGMLPILWDPQRRAWHDKVLRTVVRYAPRSKSVRAA